MSEPEVKILLENLVENSGLAIIVADESGDVFASNNNSICEVLNASKEFAPRCAMFCGLAYSEVRQVGKTISRQCHAGLNYQASSIETTNNKQLVAITGRTFLHSEDYRKATERNFSGDWQEFSTTDLFKNVILSGSIQDIEQLTNRLGKLTDQQRQELGKLKSSVQSTQQNVAEPIQIDTTQAEEISKLIEQFQQDNVQITIEQGADKTNQEIEDLTEWRSLLSSLLELDYYKACVAVADFISDRFNLNDLAWLKNENNELNTIWSKGKLAVEQIHIGISAEDDLLKNALLKETSLELRERQEIHQTGNNVQKIDVFPVSVGGNIRCALAVGDNFSDEETKRHIAKFIRQVASELEILRLRDEISKYSNTTQAVQRLNQMLKKIESDDFWLSLTQLAAELMQAERSSLLIYDEEDKEFVVKASTGSNSDVILKQNPEKLGERISQNVLRSGRPLVVKDLKTAGVIPAPSDWKYKTNSFISYPIVASGRKIGVLNITDRIDGKYYDEQDLELLHTLAPQLAVAIDHSSLIHKVDKFEQLSMTDSLTGLLNRRYLETRLNEEIKRSQRHGYPMCFMMIDVDEFKSYNDTYTHPEGDKALQLVGQCLKSTLRGADVAARYGGEEFSILLPQTTLREAQTIAERLRDRVANTRFPNRQVTISIGLANCNAEFCDAKELISAADKALYEAKTKGRNRVEVYR